MDKTSRKAFTLIELLTVIAIIAILAAILFPVFAKARQKAHTATCISNIKQLSLMFQMYASDYDQRLPGAGNGYSANIRASDWVQQTGQPGQMSIENGSLYPYAKSRALYICPDSDEPYTVGGTDWYYPSYTFNVQLCNLPNGLPGGSVAGNDPACWNGMRTTRVKFPANTFLLIEENDARMANGSFQFLPGVYNDACFYTELTALGSNTFKQTDLPPGQNDSGDRHNSGAVASYVDGHAKWHAYGDVAATQGGTGAAFGKLAAYYFPNRSVVDQLP